MIPIEDMPRLLRAYALKTIAFRTGLHPNTVYAVRCGRQTNPTYRVWFKLNEFIVKQMKAENEAMMKKEKFDSMEG